MLVISIHRNLYIHLGFIYRGLQKMVVQQYNWSEERKKIIQKGGTFDEYRGYRLNMGKPLYNEQPPTPRSYDDGGYVEAPVSPDEDLDIQRGLFNQERLEWLVSSDSSPAIRKDYLLDRAKDKGATYGEIIGAGIGYGTGVVSAVCLFNKLGMLEILENSRNEELIVNGFFLGGVLVLAANACIGSGFFSGKVHG